MAEIRDRNVYILGAGFSAPAGIPVVHDFIDRARSYFDDPSSRLDEPDRQHFAKFLEFKRKMSQAREKIRIDLDNIEELFGLVEISHRLGQEALETRASTVRVIAKTLELSTRSRRVGEINFQANQEILDKGAKPPLGFRHAEGMADDVLAADPYSYFVSLGAGLLDDPKLQKSRANTFITFNYDLLLEDAVYSVGAAPEYHLPGGGTVLELDEEKRSTPKCSILKLHGSTNWGVCRTCVRNLVVLARGLFGVASELKDFLCEKCESSTLQPLLIPPSWDKSEYAEIMRPVWSKAVEELKLASRICVIGYSMPSSDLFFKYLMGLALSENHNLYKLIVVDKNPAVEGRYRKLLEPIFRGRRFLPCISGAGLLGFLSEGRSHTELGRGELIWGNLSRR